MPAWAFAPGTSQLSCGVPPATTPQREDDDEQPEGERAPGVEGGAAAEAVEDA